jgi:hypothetical protein
MAAMRKVLITFKFHRANWCEILELLVWNIAQRQISNIYTNKVRGFKLNQKRWIFKGDKKYVVWLRSELK